MVTAATYQKAHHFRTAQRLNVLERGLLTVCRDCGWELEAWAVFSNHYHFIARTPKAANLPQMLGSLHRKTGLWLNRPDGTPARKVWHNYRETRLTYERSYLARLNYVHQNAVKHGLRPVANQYRWCSAAWFERTAAPAQVKTIYSFHTDTVKVFDAFAPINPEE